MDASATHPSDRDLRAHSLGQLDDDAAEAVNSHLAVCPDCRQRVAAPPSDRPLGRHRDAKARPTSLAPVISSAEGLPGLDGSTAGLARPLVGPLPPGLADHPDYQILQE